MPKLSPEQQLKIALGLAFALYISNGLSNSTAAKSNRPVNRDRPAAIALAASTAPVSTPGSCSTTQRQVQVPADAVLNLRSYANGPVLGTLAPGATVTAQRRDGGWSQVMTASGQSGWVFSQYLGCR